MSIKEYSEVEPTDNEIEEELNSIYYKDVTICGYTQNQAHALKRLDRVAFDMYASDNMRWYKCDMCDTVFKGEDAEDDAMACCQEECAECGKNLFPHENCSSNADTCYNCILKMEEEEETDEE